MPLALLLNSCSSDTMHPCADLCMVLSLWANWAQSTWPHSSCLDKPAEREHRGSSREEGSQNEPVTTPSWGLGLCGKAQKGPGLVLSHWGFFQVRLSPGDARTGQLC